MFSAAEKNRILSLVKDTIFYSCKDTIVLHVKILVQRSYEKLRWIFYQINEIQSFIHFP